MNARHGNIAERRPGVRASLCTTARMRSVGGMLRSEYVDLLDKYETVLNAIQRQNSVIDELRLLLEARTAGIGLARDAGVQAESAIDESTSAFLTATDLRVRIFRTARRRQVFAVAAAREVERLQALLDSVCGPSATKQVERILEQ
jgi:hypothetical protein